MLPEFQQVLRIPPTTVSADALRLMRQHGFSQLPVEHESQVIGVFSYRSFANGVVDLERESRLKAEQLPVIDFLEYLTFVNVTDEIDSILDRLDSDDAVLVGNTGTLVGIATPMDALRYFHHLSKAFLLLREIERAIRALLRLAFSDAEVIEALGRARGKPLETLEDLSFGDYVQVVGNPDNWARLEGVFGTSRELTIAKLRPVNELRNDAFHFRRELTEDDHQRLASARSWLRIRLHMASINQGGSA